MSPDPADGYAPTHPETARRRTSSSPARSPTQNPPSAAPPAVPCRSPHQPFVQHQSTRRPRLAQPSPTLLVVTLQSVTGRILPGLGPDLTRRYTGPAAGSEPIPPVGRSLLDQRELPTQRYS